MSPGVAGLWSAWLLGEPAGAGLLDEGLRTGIASLKSVPQPVCLEGELEAEVIWETCTTDSALEGIPAVRGVHATNLYYLIKLPADRVNEHEYVLWQVVLAVNDLDIEPMTDIPPPASATKHAVEERDEDT